MNKKCSQCKEIKDVKNFQWRKDYIKQDYRANCRECYSIRRKKYYEKYKKRLLSEHIEHFKANRSYYRNKNKRHYLENKSHYYFLFLKRRALKLKAIPKWANLEKIREIYLKRKKGYHVDHIIPLQNKYVCGLHVENNLQYLKAKDNLSKGNKFIST